MRSLKVLLLSLSFTSISYAGTVVISWHSFETMGEAVTNEAPDYVATGLEGRMGNVVVNNRIGGAGGGKEVVPENSKMTELKYGRKYDLKSTPTSESSVMLSSDGSAQQLARLDFMVTNLTDQPLTLESIHFDCKLLYGVIGETWVQVSHLSGKSDLESKPWPGFVPSGKLHLQAYTWHDGDVPLEEMDDLILEGGETAAFRIEVGIDGETAAGFRVDNIAIVASEAP